MAEALTLGALVRARRMALGLSQEELGGALDREQRYISRLERDKSETPPPDILHALSRLLCVTPEELLRAAGYEINHDVPDSKLNDPLVRFFITHAADLSEEEKRVIVTLVKSALRHREKRTT